MTSDQIRQVILDILGRIAPDEDLTDLDDARPFREQMELDSMDFLDIVMELRKMWPLKYQPTPKPSVKILRRSPLRWKPGTSPASPLSLIIFDPPPAGSERTTSRLRPIAFEAR